MTILIITVLAIAALYFGINKLYIYAYIKGLKDGYADHSLKAARIRTRHETK